MNLRIFSEIKPDHLDFMRQTGAVYCPNDGQPTASFVAPSQGRSFRDKRADPDDYCVVWLSQALARELFARALTDDRLQAHNPSHIKHLMRIQSPVGSRTPLIQAHYDTEGFGISNGKHRFKTWLTANAPWIPVEMTVKDAEYLPKDRAEDYAVDRPLAPLFRGPLGMVFENNEYLRDPCKAHQRYGAPMTYGEVYKTMVMTHKFLPFEIRNRHAYNRIDHQQQHFDGLMHEAAKGLYEFLDMILPTVEKIQERYPDRAFTMEDYPEQIPYLTPKWTWFSGAKKLLTRREATIEDMPLHTAAGAAARWLKAVRRTLGDEVIVTPVLKPLVLQPLVVPTP